MEFSVFRQVLIRALGHMQSIVEKRATLPILVNVKSAIKMLKLVDDYYYNKQLVDFYKSLSTPDNVRPFKSNQKVFKRCKWRHNSFEEPDKINHYTLEYRIIMSSPFKMDYYGRLDKKYCNPS